MDRLEHAKLEAIKELAYGASHEINNPLANIALRAQTLLRDEEHPDRRVALEAIHQQAMRAHEMISDLMLYARPPRLEIESFDLRELLAAVAENLAAECGRRNIRLTTSAPADPVNFRGDRQQLLVAVKAVVDNAVEAIGCDGAVEVTIPEDGTCPGQTSVSITILDSGPGISAEVREHLFEPFYSGREAGRGLGFGLPKCWRIVTDHGGTIQVESGTEGGASFTIELPISGAPGYEPAS
ncbi:MAG: HAMP domain-containing histidine kinase [Planctomycetales bacterium]|nr:HAMP domain-containing histidine kinase [Planctomycetales bacterium]